MQVAPTLPLVIGDDRPQAERRELRLGEHRTPAVASVVPPKRSAQAEPRESGSRCWLSGITAAAAKRRGDSARGNLHSGGKIPEHNDSGGEFHGKGARKADPTADHCLFVRGRIGLYA